jgi:hypothetical protein
LRHISGESTDALASAPLSLRCSSLSICELVLQGGGEYKENT